MSSANEKIKKPSRKARLSAARLSAVQSLYQVLIADLSAEQVLRDYRDHVKDQEIEGDLYVAAESDLLSRILLGVMDRQDDLKEMLKANVSQDIEKNDTLLFSVLMCGVFELLSPEDVDTPIIINEYLNITHAFYEGDESRLVNGVMDKIATSLASA